MAVYKAKKLELPAVDLSAYNTTNFIPAHVEKIIVEALIALDFDIRTVAEHFNLIQPRVEYIATKFYLQIMAVLQRKRSSKNTEDAIDLGALLIKNHITEIRDNQKKKKTSKKMSADEVKDLTKLLDRAITIQKVTTDAFDTQLKELRETLEFTRIWEERENGGKYDTYDDYLANQSAILTKITEYNNSNNMNRSTQFQPKPCFCVDPMHNVWYGFSSLTNLSEFLNFDYQYLANAISKGHRIGPGKRYIVGRMEEKEEILKEQGIDESKLIEGDSKKPL